MKKLQGIPVSPGIVIHRVKNIFSDSIPFPDRFIKAKKVDEEIKRYLSACEEAKEDVISTKVRIADSMGQDFAEIFESHVHIISDEAIQDDTIYRIRKNKYSAEHAVVSIFKKFKKMFTQMGGDNSISQKVADIEDIERRILKKLMGVTDDISRDITEEAVYVSKSLRPSQTSFLNNDFVKGVVTETGGITSHFSIMVRALGIPGIVGVEGLTKEVEDGQTIILDCNLGRVIIDPDEKTLKKYQRLQNRFKNFEEVIIRERHLPTETIDGYSVSLYGNIEFPIEAKSVITNGGEGVGLYRTEFLFMDSHQFPSEKQHISAYQEALKFLGNRPFVIRTMDLGADKFAEATGGDKEKNPFLGCRSIRFCYENPVILKNQFLAILSCSYEKDVRILLPMISTIEELRWALSLLEEAKEQLRKEKTLFNETIKVGIMIEVPSTAIIANDLAPLVDFFSIGTNDLIQYTLAVDRDNKRVSRLYSASNPAILQLIQMSIKAAQKNKISVSLCGEMASNPIFVPVLLGLGLTEYSLSAHSIPFVKNLIRKLTWSSIQEITKHVLSLHTSEEIYQCLSDFAKKTIPEYFSASEPVAVEVSS